MLSEMIFSEHSDISIGAWMLSCKSWSPRFLRGIFWGPERIGNCWLFTRWLFVLREEMNQHPVHVARGDSPGVKASVHCCSAKANWFYPRPPHRFGFFAWMRCMRCMLPIKRIFSFLNAPDRSKLSRSHNAGKSIVAQHWAVMPFSFAHILIPLREQDFQKNVDIKPGRNCYLSKFYIERLGK
jgi:hypothetical protein